MKIKSTKKASGSKSRPSCDLAPGLHGTTACLPLSVPGAVAYSLMYMEPSLLLLGGVLQTRGLPEQRGSIELVNSVQ